MKTYIIAVIQNCKQRYLETFQKDTENSLFTYSSCASRRKAKRFEEQEAIDALSRLKEVERVFPCEGQYFILEF